MPQGRPKRPRTPGTPRPRDPRPGGEGRFSPVVLASMAIGIYLLALWFGITVVGDTASRSALMAGLILGIATAWYLVEGRKRTPKR